MLKDHWCRGHFKIELTFIGLYKRIQPLGLERVGWGEGGRIYLYSYQSFKTCFIGICLLAFRFDHELSAITKLYKLDEKEINITYYSSSSLTVWFCQVLSRQWKCKKVQKRHEDLTSCRHGVEKEWRI